MKKKIYLLLLCLTASIAGMYAQNFKLKLQSGQELYGTLIETTDSTVTMILENSEGYASKPLVVTADRILEGKFPGGKILIRDGKIVALSKAEIQAEKKQAAVYARASNPNYAIGNALKKSGGTAIGIGIPCLATGLALCIAGKTGTTTKSNAVTKANCVEASYYLFGTGAALTIVGIPLYVEGKKLMDIKVNVSGNGAGITMAF